MGAILKIIAAVLDLWRGHEEKRKVEQARADGKNEKVVQDVAVHEQAVSDGLAARIDSGLLDKVDATRYRD